MTKANPIVDLSATTVDRFWSKVDRDGDCWEWVGRLGSNGYGRFVVSHYQMTAHRVAYTLVTGVIPDGLVLDHLCRNRSCVNPAHLEAVTQRENVLRGVGPCATHAAKTHCDKGHEFTADNLAKSKANSRVCKACHRDYHRAYQRKLRATSPESFRRQNSPRGVIPHGTISGYIYHKCRCDECKAAKAARARTERKPKSPLAA